MGRTKEELPPGQYSSRKQLQEEEKPTLGHLDRRQENSRNCLGITRRSSWRRRECAPV